MLPPKIPSFRCCKCGLMHTSYYCPSYRGADGASHRPIGCASCVTYGYNHWNCHYGHNGQEAGKTCKACHHALCKKCVIVSTNNTAEQQTGKPLRFGDPSISAPSHTYTYDYCTDPQPATTASNDNDDDDDGQEDLRGRRAKSSGSRSR